MAAKRRKPFLLVAIRERLEEVRRKPPSTLRDRQLANRKKEYARAIGAPALAELEELRRIAREREHDANVSFSRALTFQKSDRMKYGTSEESDAAVIRAARSLKNRGAELERRELDYSRAKKGQ